MLKNSELKRFYVPIFIAAIQTREGGEELTGAAAFKFAREQFQAEAGWNVARVGLQQAVTDWLQGLALNIPYMNGEIIELLEQTGHYNAKTTDKRREDLLEGYWRFMAVTFLWLCNRKQSWFEKGADHANN